jgi:hypothetical protein
MRTSSIRKLSKAIGVALLAGTLSACNALQGAFEPIDLGAKLGHDDRIELSSLTIALLARDPAAERVGKLSYRGGLYINSPDRRFGGLTGLMVSEDGTHLLAVSEGGYWFAADIESKDGRLMGLRHASLAPMLDGEGKPLQRRAAAATAITAAGPEAPAGSVYVAFDRKHRIWLYPYGKDGFAARPKLVELPPEVQLQTVAGGIQGLVMLSPGTLLAQSEDVRDRKYDLQGWLIPVSKDRDAKHSVVFLKASGAFKPTDLAALPGGDIFVLERSFDPARGAGMQIRRIKRSRIEPLAALDGEVIARMDVRYSIDNMEGLALRRTATGETLLYVLSNDNFSGLQRTMLLEFALTEGATTLTAR